MFEFTKDIWKQWRRRKGMQYADMILQDWENSPYSEDEQKIRIANGPLSKVVMLDDPFGIGYDFKWQQFGARDAAVGRIRAKKFKSHSYNMGWWNYMVEQHKIGWRHKALDAAFDEMQIEYWDKISSGKSDDYYTI